VPDWFPKVLSPELQFVYAAKAHKHRLRRTLDTCCPACPAHLTPAGEDGCRRCEGCEVNYCGHCLSLVASTGCTPRTGFCLVDSWVDCWKGKAAAPQTTTYGKRSSDGRPRTGRGKANTFLSWASTGGRRNGRGKRSTLLSWVST
jgi:hypothetical protein